jgi:toxin-antitoxin system PIN domain toxin
MMLFDVNVLVYAHRRDLPDHNAYRHWLESIINGSQAYAVNDLILSGFLRIVTNPRVFAFPTPLADATNFAEEVRRQPNAVLIGPSNRHWSIFRNLCKAAGARGNLIPDAFLAALAIDSGSEWITADRDYSRFPGLRWRHPLQ